MGCLHTVFFSILFIAAMVYMGTCAKMDMAPTAVDYTFSECREKMLSKVISPNGLLEEELKNNSELSAEWTQIKCNIFPGGLEEHTEALVTYSHAKRIFRQNFNKFVASKGGNMSLYQTEFFFKSLDFLLLDSMWLLNNGSDCRAVFRGTEKSYDATVGDKVRFGRFTSANTKRTDAVENCADGGTLFNIYTCSVVDLETYACLPDELELLISPLEVFSVVDVKTISDCDKVIVLNHTWSAPPPSGCILFPTPQPTTTTLSTSPKPTISLPANFSHQWLSSRTCVLWSMFLYLFMPVLDL